jgi:hypothetical protein
MISKFHFFAVALAGALVCSVAGAQVRNEASPVRRSFTHARPAARPTTNSTPPATTRSQFIQHASVIQISPSGRIISGFAPDANSFSLDTFSGVPGLGFDFPHLAAISGALRNNSPHFGHDGHHGQGTFVPILFGGYPYGYDDLGYDQPDQQTLQQAQPQLQPQIIVIQQPVPAQQSADSRSDVGALSSSEPDSQPAMPVRNVGDFILVRRDGRILFASIFSIVGAQLQYVTPEGIRHTLAISDLDADATQQMNEARGTTIQIHN